MKIEGNELSRAELLALSPDISKMLCFRVDTHTVVYYYSPQQLPSIIKRWQSYLNTNNNKDKNNANTTPEDTFHTM